MVKRPAAITVIAWIHIVCGVFALFALLTLWWQLNHYSQIDLRIQEKLSQIRGKNHLSFTVTQGIVNGAISILAGLFLLRGKNWARVLLVGWLIVCLVLSFRMLQGKPLMILPSLLFDGVIVAFLFTAKANRYFSNSDVG